MGFEPKGIPFDDLIERLEGCTTTVRSSQHVSAAVRNQNGVVVDASLLEQLDALQDLPIPILLDCSGQSQTKELYAACIERGIHVRSSGRVYSISRLVGGGLTLCVVVCVPQVVVSNARSVSSLPPTTLSRESVATSAKRPSGRTFLMYSSTIGASVPVVDTLGHILRTGDRVLRIEASLSGSMSFVATEVMHGRTLSQAVRGAMARGLCEQDPREDLTGRDTAAKIVVLARALGVTLDASAIEVRAATVVGLGSVTGPRLTCLGLCVPSVPCRQVEPLVPASVLEAVDWSSDVTVDDVVAGIKRYDDVFHQRFYVPAVAQQKRLRFVASIDLSAFPVIAAHVRPALVDESHPAFATQDDEIAFGFATLQYQVRTVLRECGRF